MKHEKETQILKLATVAHHCPKTERVKKILHAVMTHGDGGLARHRLMKKLKGH